MYATLESFLLPTKINGRLAVGISLCLKYWAHMMSPDSYNGIFADSQASIWLILPSRASQSVMEFALNASCLRCSCSSKCSVQARTQLIPSNGCHSSTIRARRARRASVEARTWACRASHIVLIHPREQTPPAMICSPSICPASASCSHI